MPSPLTSVAIIDDDEVFQMLIKKILEKETAMDSILQFSNGFAALLYFRGNTSNMHRLPLIIFLDLNMPGMTGWQLLTQLDKLQFDQPYKPSVFIISGSEAIDFERLRSFPLIKGYLTKPIEPAKLINIIHAEVKNNEDGSE